jgi:hypothetical protein|tara:strand:+ start:307 stop:789 length:483 start_codon:yes stop_codon:yes gene_type:complete
MNKELTIRSSYMKEKKEALIVLGIAIPVLCYGGFSFELQGASSNFEAITVAIAVTFGLLGVIGGLILLFTKTSLGLLDSKEPKPIIKKEKEMVKDTITKEKPVEKSGSESIGLMQREKELVKRSDELNALVNEVETELNQVRENLETKGWVNSDDGWVIE